jgi:hypothetical protein
MRPPKYISFQKALVKATGNKLLILNESKMDWRQYLTVRISLVPDCVTDAINVQSGLRQQWTGSQLIPSEVT